MLLKSALLTALVLGLVSSSIAQDEKQPKPIELEVLKAFVGVWDAEIEVWPEGLDSPSIKFKGLEKNQAYGEYWISSDFESEYGGQTMKVHSVVGYDLEKQKLVGLVIDHGPYAATLTGEYDADSKTLQWMTAGKEPDGKQIVQKTTITHKNDEERVLVMKVPTGKKDEFTKFMQINFVKRK